MIIKKLFRPRTLIAVVAVLVIMIAAYAYAAANTVPPTAAGEGQSITSGYDITNVQYLLTANDPSTISGITFDVAPKDPLAGTLREVKVQLITDGAWFDCTVAGGSATCSNIGVAVAAAGIFRVVAVQ